MVKENQNYNKKQNRKPNLKEIRGGLDQPIQLNIFILSEVKQKGDLIDLDNVVMRRKYKYYVNPDEKSSWYKFLGPKSRE